MPLEAGQLFGNYRVVRLLGEGGFGEGLACYHQEETGRPMLRFLARLSLGIAIGSALCLSAPLCEGSALAAGLTAKETAKAKQAKQLYKEGQYEQAAKLFSSLSSDHPELLVFTRNLGACYYYLRRPEPALSNLREYLRRETDITPEDRSEVEGWMAEMEKLRDRLHAPSVAPAAPASEPRAPATEIAPPYASAPPSYAPGPSPAPPATPLPPVAAAAFQPAAEPSASAVSQGPSSAVPTAAVTTAAQPPARSYRTLAWVAGGVGVAGLIAGGVFTALALSNFSSTASQYNRDDQNAGKTYAALQWVGYGLGAAGIGTAIVLFTLDAKPSGSVALTPMLGQGFAGASVAGTY
jgi:tetratricopeptide (TPR) repeat protein